MFATILGLMMRRRMLQKASKAIVPSPTIKLPIATWKQIDVVYSGWEGVPLTALIFQQRWIRSHFCPDGAKNLVGEKGSNYNVRSDWKRLWQGLLISSLVYEESSEVLSHDIIWLIEAVLWWEFKKNNWVTFKRLSWDWGLAQEEIVPVWTHWKRLWCWEGLGAGGEGDDRG